MASIEAPSRRLRVVVIDGVAIEDAPPPAARDPRVIQQQRDLRQLKDQLRALRAAPGMPRAARS